VRAVKTFKYFFFLIFLLVTNNGLQAQIVDADTTVAAVKNVNTEKVHSPGKAAKYSAILPGLGQAYNKKYWKIPLVYIGLGTIGYFTNWNNSEYKFMKTCYIHLDDGDDTTEDYLKLKGINNFNLDDASDLAYVKSIITTRQAYFRRTRDLLIISMFAFYGLNIIDASVDAHLFNFDIGDDLTMDWQPSMHYSINSEPAYCINFSLKF
jgi:hypothetical protein